jgi:hypothetical protein
MENFSRMLSDFLTQHGYPCTAVRLDLRLGPHDRQEVALDRFLRWLVELKPLLEFLYGQKSNAVLVMDQLRREKVLLTSEGHLVFVVHDQNGIYRYQVSYALQSTKSMVLGFLRDLPEVSAYIPQFGLHGQTFVLVSEPSCFEIETLTRGCPMCLQYIGGGNFAGVTVEDVQRTLFNSLVAIDDEKQNVA